MILQMLAVMLHNPHQITGSSLSLSLSLLLCMLPWQTLTSAAASLGSARTAAVSTRWAATAANVTRVSSQAPRAQSASVRASGQSERGWWRRVTFGDTCSRETEFSNRIKSPNHFVRRLTIIPPFAVGR